jgi:hypothetical protein
VICVGNLPRLLLPPKIVSGESIAVRRVPTVVHGCEWQEVTAYEYEAVKLKCHVVSYQRGDELMLSKSFGDA